MATVEIPSPPENFDWEIPTTDDEVHAAFQHILKFDIVSMDTETNGKAWWNFDQSDIAGVSFTTPDLKNYYIPLNQVRHSVEQKNANIPLVRAYMRTAINKKITIIGGNLKFDWHVIWRTLGLNFTQNPCVDILLVSHLININDKHSVKNIGTQLIGPSATFWEKMIVQVRAGMGITKKDPLYYDYRQIPLYAIAPYATCDTWLAMLAYKYWMRHPQLSQFADYIKLEHDTARYLFITEETGIKIDTVEGNRLLEGFEESLPVIEAKIFRQAGKFLNVQSDDQLFDLVYNQLKLPIQYKVDMKTHERKATLDKTALLSLKDLHPVIPLIQAHRKETDRERKIKAIIDSLDYKDRLHSTFNQFKEDTNKLNTGRLSSSDPVNIENIPTNDTTIRRLFVPDNEFVLCDYSGQEIRIYTHYSGEPTLLRAYANNEDVHSRTTEAVFNVPYEKIIAGRKAKNEKIVNMRDFAKRFFFGKLYGSGLSRVAELMAEYDMGYNLAEARRLDNNFLGNMPKFKAYMKELEMEYFSKGFVDDFLGRHYVPRDFDKLYVLLNYKIQGSASGILKTTFCRVCKEVSPNIFANLVHDEGIYDRLESREMVYEIKRISEDFDHLLKLPMPIEISYAHPNWEAKKPIDDLDAWVNEAKIAA